MKVEDLAVDDEVYIEHKRTREKKVFIVAHFLPGTPVRKKDRVRVKEKDGLSMYIIEDDGMLPGLPYFKWEIIPVNLSEEVEPIEPVEANYDGI